MKETKSIEITPTRVGRRENRSKRIPTSASQSHRKTVQTDLFFKTNEPIVPIPTTQIRIPFTTNEIRSRVQNHGCHGMR